MSSGIIGLPSYLNRCSFISIPVCSLITCAICAVAFCSMLSVFLALLIFSFTCSFGNGLILLMCIVFVFIPSLFNHLVAWIVASFVDPQHISSSSYSSSPYSGIGGISFLYASIFLSLFSIILFLISGSSVEYPYSSCSSLLARYIPFLCCPGIVLLLTPVAVSSEYLLNLIPLLASSFSSSFVALSSLIIGIFLNSSGSCAQWLSDRCLSLMIITGVWYFSAMFSASCVISYASAGVPGASTNLGKSPCPAFSMNFRSDCSVQVGIPVAGPPLIASTITSGVSVIAASEYPSFISANPPPLVPVIALAPAVAAPIAMFMADISSSVCLTTILYFCCSFASVCSMLLAGVIGYAE